MPVPPGDRWSWQALGDRFVSGLESRSFLASHCAIEPNRASPRGLFGKSERSAFPGEVRLQMTTIRVKENEPFDVALRRFKRTIEKIGLLTELRAREFYEKPTAERKRKKAAAVKRHFKRVRSMQLPKKLY